MNAAPPFKRILIANRGEIAVRIVRACQVLGVESVVAVSDADRDTLAARLATRAVCVGPTSASASYLKIGALIEAARGTGCQAIHPGYGFLSERAEFSRACAENGLVFIGPSPEAIQSMGDKLTAIGLADSAGVARVPGSDSIADLATAQREAQRIGYPVLFKASAGGGGRGMRLVRSADQLQGAMESASGEALAAFGDATLYMEKFIDRARHIEVQILGDSHGNVLHLGERDCSTQRRHQKLIEEAPSVFISEKTRQRVTESAVRLAQRVNYQGAGTVEFVYDEVSDQAYFLEMNTRIQVEHPVTEMVTGRDLVVEQIRIAAGLPISFTQAEVVTRGHSIECRINAEDAARGFAPAPGRIQTWNAPEGPGLRVDSHCYPGYLVPPYYDSLLAKLIVHSSDRASAIALMSEALSRFKVDGISTTIDFQKTVMIHPDFAAGRVTTRWVEESLLVANN